jgi:zinc protease
MLFKGTERRGVGDVAGEVEGAGGHINAYTSYDVTCYHATLPSDQLSTGVDVLSDAVLHSVFDPVEISREVEVVLEEIRRADDSPGHVLAEAVLAEAYRVHPYRAPILGTAESVASFDRDRVRAFFERWYTPDNLVVVAAGDFETPQLLEQVRAAFGARQGRGARRDRPVEPAQSGLRTIVCPRDFERVRIEFANVVVGLRHPDAAPLDLLAFVLGCGDSSRLVRRVKERGRLVERIDASCYTPIDPGVSSVNLETDIARAPEAIEATVSEIDRLRREPVSSEELERARANFLASEEFERESVSGLAHKVGNFHVAAGDHRAEERYLAAIRAATPDDLQRVARSYLAPEGLTIGAVLPKGEAEGLDRARIEAAVARGLETTARTFSAPSPRRASGALSSFELHGGAMLHVIPRRDVPVVAARAAFLGGTLAEDAASSGLSSFLASMWLRGTRTHATADFARHAEGVAAEIDGFTGRNSLGLTLEVLSDRLDVGLGLFTEALIEPAFDAEEIERERGEVLAAIERRADRLAQRAFLLFCETHYGDHPYARPLMGDRESVAKFDRAAVAAHHARLVRASNLVVAVAGDVDPEAIASRLSAQLAALDPSPTARPDPPLPPPPTGIQTAEISKDRAQAHLVIGFRGLTVDDEDRYALEVISQLLAGQGGRLFLELRDRRSLAYALNAVNVEGVAPGYFAVYIATAPEKFEEARTGLLEQLAQLVASAPDAGELERARRYLAGAFVIDRQRNASHAAHAALDALYGLGANASNDYPERIAAISRDDVLRVAQRVIDLDAYTLASVRP